MKNEKDMAAFEAAMRYHGFFTPQRFPLQASAGIAAQDEYLSARDQDRYAGWKMAMEANGDERELCARVVLANAHMFATPKAAESLANAIRERGVK